MTIDDDSVRPASAQGGLLARHPLKGEHNVTDQSQAPNLTAIRIASRRRGPQVTTQGSATL